MPLAQALQEKSAAEIAAEESAQTAQLLSRSQWLNDPYTKAKLEQLINWRNTQMSNAMTLSLQTGKDAEVLTAARNAALADAVIGTLTA